VYDQIASYGSPMPNPESPADLSPSGVGAPSITELYDRFHRPALALARRIVVEDGLAEDVLQEVFLSVWRDHGAFDATRGSFATWLMTLVHHKAVDAVRHEEAHRRRQRRAEGRPAPGWRLAGDVAGEACDRATHAQVRTALSALPPRQREALSLAYFSGYTQQEIATLTATPLGTVKSRTTAGVRQLRRDLRRLAPTVGAAPAH
jgi:RNA polymerase sigma-70 factor (ECF subfamily)